MGEEERELEVGGKRNLGQGKSLPKGQGIALCTLIPGILCFFPKKCSAEREHKRWFSVLFVIQREMFPILLFFISSHPLSVGLQHPEEGAQQREGGVWGEGGVVPNLLLNQHLRQMQEDKVKGTAQRIYLPGEH